jgi:transposase-like protein
LVQTSGKSRREIADDLGISTETLRQWVKQAEFDAGVRHDGLTTLEREELRQVLCGLTSLPPERGTANQILALKRGHWQIENRLHRIKDVSLGEDASLIHTGQGPTVLALLRETAINVPHRAGIHRIAARLREHRHYPERAVALVLESPMTHA